MRKVWEIGDDAGTVTAPRWHDESVPIPKVWCLLRVHPNRERKVERDLQLRALSYTLPMYPREVSIGRRGGNAPTRLVETPLFPGIIFIPDFDATITNFRGIDGVSGFLHFGTRLAMARPSIMQELRNLCVELRVPRSKRERLYQTGQLVRINDGAFQGWSGRIERLDEHGRLRILIDAIKRGVPVELSETQVELVSHPTDARTAR